MGMNIEDGNRLPNVDKLNNRRPEMSLTDYALRLRKSDLRILTDVLNDGI